MSLNNAGGIQRDLVQAATSSVWFQRFYQGCRSRMGQDYCPNLALTTLIIARMLDLALSEVAMTSTKEDKFDLIIFGSHMVTSHVLSLRGNEGLMLNLATIEQELKVKRACCIVALRGKVKGESIERDHIFPCCKVTSSGIKVENWLKMLATVHKWFGRKGDLLLQTPIEKSYLQER